MIGELIFNGTDLSPLLKVEEVRRPFLPPSEYLTYQSTKGYDRFYKRQLKSYAVEADVRLIRKSRIDLKEVSESVRSILYTEKPVRIQLRDEPNKYNVGICSADSIEYFLRTGFSTLEFYCFEPFLYADNEKTVSISAGLKTIENQGLHDTEPIITVTGATGNNIRIDNETTGEYVLLNHNFTGTDTITFNHEKELVKINGAERLKLLNFQSDFFALKKGTNQLKCSNGTAVIKYRERW